MGVKIHAYFVNELGLSHEEASELHHSYYTQYGLALAGLIKHHQVDPLDFDRKCDQSLPLEDMIKPSPTLRKLFEDIDRTKFRVWALTNAYRPHAERVLRILNLTDQIDGLVYCDYEAKDLTSKPNPVYYERAMAKAGISEPSKCYFVDDNLRNVEAALNLGWTHSVYFCEKGLEHVEGGKVQEINAKASGKVKGWEHVITISDLEELRDNDAPVTVTPNFYRGVWPEVFGSGS
uniref:Putative pyrimidine 5-nucleotidase n=1 Tax=Moniliophthora roreri TaxID=221103 RepID=A0A0W0FJZ9_MONRR